mgnify:CR=1 FL=1
MDEKGAVLAETKTAADGTARMAKLTASRGFAAELSTSMIIMIAAQYGLPTSSSQCITGGIIGIALCEGKGGLNFNDDTRYSNRDSLTHELAWAVNWKANDRWTELTNAVRAVAPSMPVWWEAESLATMYSLPQVSTAGVTPGPDGPAVGLSFQDHGD